jgi:hypothetical protein
MLLLLLLALLLLILDYLNLLLAHIFQLLNDMLLLML